MLSWDAWYDNDQSSRAEEACMDRRTSLLLGLGLLLAVLVGELVVRLAAVFSVEVRYLATAGMREAPHVFRSLDEYLAAQGAHVTPHRDFLNYRANALGLYDEEFAVPKPPGRFRIMALGDSFTYGSAPDPDSVMARLEANLHAACHGVDMDLLNFGVPATGVWDYKTIFQLGHALYDPDLVLVNIYLGNDGPDSYRHSNDLPKSGRHWRHSFFWSYLRNAVRLWSGLPSESHTRAQIYVGADPRPKSAAVRGGAMVEAQRTLPVDDPQLVGPSFTENAFADVIAAELGRLYMPENARSLERDWRPILAVLDDIHAQVRAVGRRLIITLYPSAVQVYPELRQKALAQLQQRPRYARLTAERIDPNLPTRILMTYCVQHGIACIDLTPSLVRASGASPEPLYKLRDTHWTVRGNRVAAEAQARQLVPLVCPSANSAVATPAGE
jgi:hypothetical protein